MKKERPELFPDAEYKFGERLKDLQIYIKKCFREAVKTGFPEKLTNFSVRNPIKERRSVQIKFSPAVMRLLIQVLKRREIQQRINEQKEIEGLDKIIAITAKEVFIISEGGIQIFRSILKTSCKIIKKQLENKEFKRRKKIELSKNILRQKIKNVLLENKGHFLISVAYKENKKKYVVTLISGKFRISLHDKSPKKLCELIDNHQDFIKNFA